MRKKIIPTPLNLHTPAINNVLNCYWSCRRLIKVIQVEVFFNYSLHQRTQIWNANKRETISFENMDKSSQHFYNIMAVVMFQIV